MAVLPANPSLRLLAPSLFLFRASVAVFALFATLIKCGQKITCTGRHPVPGSEAGMRVLLDWEEPAKALF